MSVLKRIIHFILTIWFAFGVLSSLMVVYPFIFIFLRLYFNRKIAINIRNSWFKFCLFWGGVRVKTIFETPLTNNRAYLIAANHTSKLDIISLPTQFNQYTVFMAKEEFKNVPLLGISLRKLDVLVNFKNKSQSILAMRKAASLLQKGISMIIFPEGKIGRHTPKLIPFKNGAFKLAIENQVDVVPVTIIGSWKLLSDENIYYFSPGNVIQVVHAPISTKGMTMADVEQLKQQVFHIIANKLAEHGYNQ